MTDFKAEKIGEDFMDRNEQLKFLINRQLKKTAVKGALRRKIYGTKLIDLVKTIEKETNELFGNFPDKIDLQNNTIYFSVRFMGELNTLLTDVALDMVEAFLTQINRSAASLTEQDMHRIIMVLALMIYADCNNKKAKELEDLVKNMDLIK
jgi:hypothetical protein